ncbi:PIR Superfamily Protein [Plasmodium ovale curtisi]|uniref:PIR Superfamily Protein n=1 Tax=Plasmodium ovale curtisi TaxID=864141 RepID=A0A1A8XE16_PLAOA|nr:PIR Superfamily Protein [Plasmodium ovale curtisi]
MSSSESNMYAFFENFKTYRLYEMEMEQTIVRGRNDTKCDSFSYDDRKFGTEKANHVCVKFKILYQIIKSKKNQPNNRTLDDIDFAYLNYWLNIISRNNMISNNLTVDEFQSVMSHVENEFFYDDFDEKLYDIKDKDFNNMNLLNELQNNHAEIYNNLSTRIQEENKVCRQYFQKYIDTYKKGIIKCPHDNTSFCKALRHIKGEYERDFLEQYAVTEKCIDLEFIKLPTYNEVSLEEKKNTIFTPFRQWIHSKIGLKKGTNSNLYEEHNQSFLNISDNEDINSDYNQYGISYDSVVNS